MTSPSRVVSGGAVYIGLALGAVITLAPFTLGLLTSFTSARQFNTESPLSLPTPPTVENYTGLGDAGFGRALVVTALMTAVILLGQMTFSVLAAYAFARLQFPGRDLLFWVYVATLMVPATVTVVPLYLMMAEAGLRNTFWALVLPFMFGSPYAIFLLREYFRAIPADLINAARIDGANTLDVIAHVVLPAARPILVTLALITVVSQWSNFMWPLVITSGDMLDAVGVELSELMSLRWSLGNDDTLRPLLTRLTVDTNGRSAATPGFDADRVRQWGYNAANDLQGIYLNYIGSAAGVFSVGDRFAFDNPQSAEAFEYLVRLINTDHVAPPASDTNDNGDFSRNQFLQGRMALFQSGTYNLAAIADQARFRWGVAMLPAGPKGRVSVTNGIAAAANSATKHPDAVRQVLLWMGSRHGNEYLGARGAAIPAVLAAQPVYNKYWESRGVDVGPFFKVLNGPRIPAPGGAGFAAGFDALKPYFDEMFLGRRDVASSLAEAQQAANAAAQR